MDRRIYHGNISPQDLGQALLAEFDRGNLQVQEFHNKEKVFVQIATQEWLRSGGHTAISVSIEPHQDGIAVQIGKQSWFGVVASLGQTALSTLLNPWNLLARLDDLAQDVESINLSEQIWQLIERTVKAAGASFELSERMRSVACSYCKTANPIGESNCVGCGAPLGMVQPYTCPHCGFILRQEETHCPNCGSNLRSRGPGVS
jgi:hypothetical protein